MVSPVQPLSVAPLGPEHSAELAACLAPWLAAAPYTAPMDEAAVRREILSDDPPTVYPVRWRAHLRLGVWRARQLIAFLDAAVGLDADNLDRPVYRPIGLIRFLALPRLEYPSLQTLTARAAAALLERVQGFWREHGVAHIKAFHLSTGYPSFQAGAGILPGGWGEQVRVLTGAGFQFTQRYYCFYRPLTDPVEEVVPMTDLNLVYRGVRDARQVDLYHRRIDWVARARVVRATQVAPPPGLPTHSDEGPAIPTPASFPGTPAPEPPVAVAPALDLEPFAYLPELTVDARWQRQKLGRWLLRRVINDATFQGYPQLVVHLAHDRTAGLNLLIQQGFRELSYRGYTLELGLTS